MNYETAALPLSYFSKPHFGTLSNCPLPKNAGGDDNTIDNRQNRSSKSVPRIGVNAAVKLQRFRHKFNLLSPVHEPLHP
jgi:hypothetical protein